MCKRMSDSQQEYVQTIINKCITFDYAAIADVYSSKIGL
jgi:hypothetical protein